MGVDSAGSLFGRHRSEDNVYFNSEKLLNLICGRPIGLATAGVGSFAGRSTIRLARDLRDELSEPSSALYVDPENYKLSEVADRIKTFFFTNLYEPTFGQAPTAGPLQFILAGYSARERSPEVWTIDMEGTHCEIHQAYTTADQEGAVWRGQGEPLTRLLRGWNSDAWERLASLGVPEADIQSILETVALLWHPAMPIQDAIDLVR